MTTKGHTRLTHEQIDSIVEELSAGDLIDAGLGQDGVAAMKAMRSAFDAAASRLGLAGTEQVAVADLSYWSKAIGGAVNVESPLSEGTGDLLASADTGE